MRVLSKMFLVIVAAGGALGCGSSSSSGAGGGGAPDASLHGDGASGQEGGGYDASSGNDAQGSPDAQGGNDAGGTSDAGADACATAVYGQPCTQSTDCACGGSCAANVCIAPFPCTDALLTWTGPTENTDGTCLTDLAGFNIHYGMDAQAPDQNIIDAGLPCAPGPNLACGDAGMTAVELNCADLLTGFADGSTWYFTVYAYTSGGVESPASGEGSKTFACP